MKNGDGGIVGPASGLHFGAVGVPILLAAVLAVIMGGYAGAQYLQRAERAEQVKQVAQAEQRPHCDTVNAQFITEFDAIIAQGKFPSDAQQETWKRLTAGCQ